MGKILACGSGQFLNYCMYVPYSTLSMISAIQKKFCPGKAVKNRYHTPLLPLNLHHFLFAVPFNQYTPSAEFGY